jgi:hypothetical protein
MAISVDGKVKPPWGSLRDKDRSEIKDLLRRLAGPRKQSAASAELLLFIGEGYVDKEFALTAMVRAPSEENDMSNSHLMSAPDARHVSLAHAAFSAGTVARQGWEPGAEELSTQALCVVKQHDQKIPHPVQDC